MKIFAFVGISDSGKTHLMRKLINELKGRGYTVSVIKHCAQGFDIEEQGKDTAQFRKAGSDSVCMYSPDGMAVFQQKKTELDVKMISREYLKCSDFILVEGAKSDKSLKKIEVLRKGFSEKILCSPEELIAVVSDFDMGKDIPVFHPEDIEKIADFMENYPEEKEPLLWLDIDDVSIPMNPFVQKIFTQILMGMIRSLEGIPENPECITLSLSRKGKEDEKI
ncbi:MAG: molybdopterin-guanine dinucleotide biosynthesis protein B [Candidatus Aminicenantes bacterium]|jgi:molybdopterin-guanine dinucleotide biosynthesis protein B